MKKLPGSAALDLALCAIRRRRRSVRFEREAPGTAYCLTFAPIVLLPPHLFTGPLLGIVCAGLAGCLGWTLYKLRSTRKANERMSHILESTSEGIFKLRYNWTVSFVNQQALKTLPEIGLERNYWKCYPEAKGTQIEENMQRTMLERVPTQWQNFWEPHGQWFSVHCFPIRGGMSVFFTQVTAQKLLEQKLHEELKLRSQNEQAERDAKEQLNHILDSTSEGIQKLDRDWSIVYANRRAREISPELGIGSNFWALYPTLLGTAAETGLYRAMNERLEARYEVHYAPYAMWFSVGAFPTPSGISLFYRDITSEKKLGEQLARERLLREKRIEALSNMAGGLAHEISNPLAIIYGTAEDLQRLAQTEGGLAVSEVLDASTTIVKTSDRAIRILRGLRGFAREAGNDPMQNESLHEIVQQAIELQEARFCRHGVGLRLEIPPELPPIRCRGTQIGQIITNLLNNAYDAIVEQNCVERWVCLQVQRNDPWVHIDITDSGMGVSDEAREHLMDPFFTTKTRGIGMGIGLSLSNAIAHEHGGTLELCKDTPHTCFRLRLRAHQQADQEQPADTKEAP